MLETRIIDLEIKFTVMEDLVDQLNQIVTAQQMTIDKLLKDIHELKLANLNNNNQGPRSLADDVPPHY